MAPCDRVVVTGASGFVGRALARAAGAPSTRCTSAPPDWAAQHRAARRSAGATIFHLAARVHDPRDARRGRPSSATTSRRRARSPRRPRARGARRLVFLSTIKVNGEESRGRPLRAERSAGARGRLRALEARRPSSALAAVAARAPASRSSIVRSPLVYRARRAGQPARLLRARRLALAAALRRASTTAAASCTSTTSRALLLALRRRSRRPRAAPSSRRTRDARLDAALVRALRRALGRPARLFAVPAAVLEARRGARGPGRAHAPAHALARGRSVGDAQRELGWTPRGSRSRQPSRRWRATLREARGDERRWIVAALVPGADRVRRRSRSLRARAGARASPTIPTSARCTRRPRRAWAASASLAGALPFAACSAATRRSRRSLALRRWRSALRLARRRPAQPAGRGAPARARVAAAVAVLALARPRAAHGHGLARRGARGRSPSSGRPTSSTSWTAPTGSRAAWRVIGFGALAVAAARRRRMRRSRSRARRSPRPRAGFLAHNFPPARVFLGDCGLDPAGLPRRRRSACTARSRAPGRAWFPLLVFSPFIVDATRHARAARSRAASASGARTASHCYQRLVLAGWTRRRLALAAYALMAARRPRARSAPLRRGVDAAMRYNFCLGSGCTRCSSLAIEIAIEQEERRQRRAWQFHQRLPEPTMKPMHIDARAARRGAPRRHRARRSRRSPPPALLDASGLAPERARRCSSRLRDRDPDPGRGERLLRRLPGRLALHQPARHPAHRLRGAHRHGAASRAALRARGPRRRASATASTSSIRCSSSRSCRSRAWRSARSRNGRSTAAAASRARRWSIMGAGDAAVGLVKELSRSHEWRVVGLLDDDEKKRGRLLHGVRVLGRARRPAALRAAPEAAPRDHRHALGALQACAAAWSRSASARASR